MKQTSSEEVLRMLYSEDPSDNLYALGLFPQYVGPPTPQQALRLAEVHLNLAFDSPYLTATYLAGVTANLLSVDIAESHRSAHEIVKLFVKASCGDQDLIEIGFWEPFVTYAKQLGVGNPRVIEVKLLILG